MILIVHPRHEGLPKALALAEISSFTKDDEGVEILSIQEQICFGFGRTDAHSAVESVVRAEAARFPVAPPVCRRCRSRLTSVPARPAPGGRR
jgi:hypothetical protein